MSTILNNVAFAGAILGATTALAVEELPAVPSHQTITLQEVLLDDRSGAAPQYARFRFVTPGIGANLTFTDVEADFPVLCNRYAVPVLQARASRVDQVVISFASQPIDFGVADPDTTQYFEAFRLENGACIWESF